MLAPVLFVTLGLFASGAFPTSAHADQADDNLIMNPGFDQNLNGWNNAGTGSLQSGIWSSLDAQDSGSSGSAQLTNRRLGGYFISSACVPVEPAGEYVFGANYRIPSGQNGNANPAVCLNWYEGEDCTNPIDENDQDCVNDSTQGSWIPLEGSVDARAGAHSVQLYLWNLNRFGGEYVVHFDDAVLLPEPSQWAQTLVVIALGALRAGAAAPFPGWWGSRREARSQTDSSSARFSPATG